MTNSNIIGAQENEDFIELALDEIEKDRNRRGCRDLLRSHCSRFFRKENNLDDNESNS